MSVSTTHPPVVKKWRVIVFDIVAVLFILFFAGFFSGAFSLLPPWLVLESASLTYHPDIHRWHSAIWGVWTAILLSGSLIALLWQAQRKPLMAQFFLIGVLFLSISAFASRSPNPLNFIAPLFIALLFLLVYPTLSSLFSFSRKGGWSIPLLIVSTLAVVLLAPDIWRNIALQITDKTSEHALSAHWLISVDVDILLIIAGFLASTKRAGWMPLCIILGIAFLYLGAAALSVPTQTGSWGTIGGVLSILGGLGSITIAVYEMRVGAKHAQTAVPQTSRAVNTSL